MQESHCPYCHSIRSMLLGDVYCSVQQKKSMADLSTGTLFIRSRALEETCEHISRLSIRCNLSGGQHYKVGGNDHLVHPGNYLVVNQGQHYKTSFSAATEQEMILVAFQPGFAERLYYSLTNSTDTLLNDPFSTHDRQITFFEKTYPADPVITALFSKLRSLMDADIDTKERQDLDSIYTSLFMRLLHVQRGVIREADVLRECKRSTRVELCRRLSIAKDYMDAHISNKMSLEEIAKVSCLSLHHFKRTFRTLYGCAPHQYLVRKRMEKACNLLATSTSRVDDIALSCGFENTSAFIRQFRATTGTTPMGYRLAHC